MRSLFLAGSALALTALAPGASRAADLPRRAAPAYAAAPPTFTWTGPYLGFDLGGAFSAAERAGLAAVAANTFGPGTPALPTTLIYGKRERGGFTGGGHAGYNLGFTEGGSGAVVGVEADLQYANLTSDRTGALTALPAFAPPAAVAFLDPRGSRGVDWFGTLRGRAGYAFDRLLAYGTGGLAFGQGSPVACFGTFGCGDTVRTGWAAGGGVEYALPTDAFLYVFHGGALTLRAEALYVSLERGRNSGLYAYNTATNAAYYAPVSRRDRDDFAIVRAGLSYKFGW